MKQSLNNSFKIKLGMAVIGLFMAPLALAMLDTRLNAGQTIRVPTRNNPSILSPIITPTPKQANQITSTPAAEAPTQPAYDAITSVGPTPVSSSNLNSSTPQSQPSRQHQSNQSDNINNGNKNNQSNTNILGISIPLGATAICNDGTFSFIVKSPSTCYHHHGVKKWF